MIPIKAKKEIEIMKRGGRILAKAMSLVIENARPGVKTAELDRLAENFIKKNKAQPGFKMVKGYRWASCININDGLVHGVPGDYRIKDGDVLTVDLGVYYQGFNTDMARTFQVAAREHLESVPQTQHNLQGGGRMDFLEVNKFLETGRTALKKAIEAAQPGNYLGHISKAIQKIVGEAGYNCSYNFTGHGVGKQLHEEPPIPCFLWKKLEKTPKLKKGMVFAIEVIYAQGSPEVKIAEDGWTAKTIDGKLGALFEDTVAINEDRPIVLTMV